MDKKTKYVLEGLGVITFFGFLIGISKRKEIMEFILTKEHEYFIKDLHPKAKTVMSNLLKMIMSKGYNAIVTSGHRTFQDQVVQKKKNPKNAAPGLSTHNYGLAIDINLQKGTSFWKKKDTKEKWLETGIPQIAKEMGLRWGGDAFAGYHDPVHFDIPLDTQILFAQAKKQFGNNPENIKGNEVFIA